MKKPFILLLFLSVILCASAQRRKAPVKVKRPVAAANPGIKIFNQMLESTAKVMFIDSVVVNKADFLAHVPLNSESGNMRLVNTKADFPNQLSSFQNEFGDRRISAAGDSASSYLCTQTLLGDKWSKAAKITDFDAETYTHQNYPFLDADGVTLYFSAEGPESMGGRDIFMSTFDSDKGQWYKPQNYGLPFNSTANDYLLAIDDLDTLGWLVTDRRQPEGKVCIYTFVPTETRQNFDDDDLDDDELAFFARIMSIKSTWKFGNRTAAIKRRDAMLARSASNRKDTPSMRFIVNDNTIITSPSQFRNSESRQLYSQIVELRQMITETEANLDKARTAYHNGNHSLSASILKSEGDLEQQRTDLHNLVKKIRALENTVK